MQQSAESFESVHSFPGGEALRRHVVLVGNLVLLQFQQACEGKAHGGQVKAEQMAKRQVDIALLVGDGEELVLSCLRQPGLSGSELRTAVATGQVLREYELIAREAVSLAEAVAQLGPLQGPGTTGLDLHHEVATMRSGAQRLLQASLEVLSSSDSGKALSVSQSQAYSTKEVASGLRRLVAFVALDAGGPTTGFAVEEVFRSLEKVSEHAKKVCECVAYTVHGKKKKHELPPRRPSASETSTVTYGAVSSGFAV